MLVIRLQRTGRSNLATYRIVVGEKARPAQGKFQEIVGHYLPAQGEGVFEANAERITHWIGKGAIPSDTVARLLKKSGMKDMDKFIQRYTKRRSKKAPPEEEAPPAAPAAAPEAAPAAEAPAEEVKQEEAPKEETPAAEESTEAAPAEEAPKEEAPAEEGDKA